ncbi:hypothetical protein VNI00_008158 [Paramarasmius palmivorus]|uniref:Extracellular membrane protein CFEM domain-containing protein n=1 Tax=Paramarasmius palmivorus TaxID=297713 RepID=A0AAW0CZ78_9AGAR
MPVCLFILFDTDPLTLTPAAVTSASLTSRSFSVLASTSSPEIPDTVPAACDKPCNTMPKGADPNCDDPSCLCTNAWADQIASCLDCVVANDKTFSLQEAQGVADAFTNNCGQLGFKVKSEKISANSALKSAATGMVLVTGTGAMMLLL